MSSDQSRASCERQEIENRPLDPALSLYSRSAKSTVIPAQRPQQAPSGAQRRTQIDPSLFLLE
jgi:hypothetical protein